MAPIVNVRNVYNNLFRNNFVKKLLPVNPTARQAANLALISTLTKDALGCAIYTTQSYNNKEIPDNKRTFVTALDFSNGVCNVFIPMITGPILSKNSDKLFNRWFGHHFDDNACKRMYNKLQKTGLKVAEKDLENVIKKQSRNWGVAGFGVITMLVYSQILCKRMLTPTISTTLADYVKVYIEKIDKRKAAKAAELEKLKEQNSTEEKDNKVEKVEENNTQINPFKQQSIYVVSPSFKNFNDLALSFNKK